MAPPSRSVPRPGRALAALGVIVLIMLISITGSDTFSPGKWHKDFRVGLGLDLASGTQVTLMAQGKGTPSQADMNTAISIMEARVNGTGNSGAQVQQQGNNQITISVPNQDPQQVINLVSTTAQLRIRQALLEQPYTGTSASSSASPSPSSSASPKASSSASPTTKASPSSTSTAKTSAKIVKDAASATPSASASASATPKASSSAKASASPTPTPSATSSASTTYFGNKASVNASVFKLFEKATCKPGSNSTTVDNSWKNTIKYTPTQWDDPNAQIVSCDPSGNKYVLGNAVVLGSQVSSANAGLNSSSQWVVDLTLGGKAQSAFGTLTTKQYNTYYSGCNTSGNEDDCVLNSTGIVLDGNVVSVEQTIAAITAGNVEISGSFTQSYATYLANVLKYGALPLTFKVLSSTSISPQLARSSLDAGLIAALIGFVLVVGYCFLYYRGLGIVSVSSLLIAALLAFLSVALLTKYQNFGLELSGIAGLIVAVGITADSFVVFFERLRDEVRDGKSLRPAVESGWKRARRTILVSDTVSFLAALVLYELAIGEVRGFAYTLGLTTIIDVVVVFLFTKPMVTLLAGTKFFGGGHRWSGLSPDRLGARTPWRSSIRRQPAGRASRIGNSGSSTSRES